MIVEWRPRSTPLTPGGVVARGDAAWRLASTLLHRTDDELQTLRGLTCSRQWLLLMGDEDSLPWSDGVTYVGRDVAVPALWLPTTMAPSVPVEILLEIATRHLNLDPPTLLLPSPGESTGETAAARRVSAVSLAGGLRVTKRHVEAWLEH